MKYNPWMIANIAILTLFGVIALITFEEEVSWGLWRLGDGIRPERSPERVICASRLNDYVDAAVRSFNLNFDKKPTKRMLRRYPEFRTFATEAAAGFGLDLDSPSHTLHVALGSRRNGLGLSPPAVYLIICEIGAEADYVCRQAAYTVFDHVLNSERFALMLHDILTKPVPAVLRGCPFSGSREWAFFASQP